MNQAQAARHDKCALTGAEEREARALHARAMALGDLGAAARAAMVAGNHFMSWQARMAMEALPPAGFRAVAEDYLGLLRFDALVDFDAFLIYNEHRRDRGRMFYLPRRRVMRLIADDLQDLHDREIAYYALSLPQRIGKTTIAQFYMAWEMGLAPDERSLMGAHGAILCEKFYRAVAATMTDKSTYAWADLFPKLDVVLGGDQDKTIDLVSASAANKRRDMATVRAVTIETGFQGSVEVSEGGFLYTDDLVSGREEALNPRRLDDKFDTYKDMRGRLKEGHRELMVGARWNRRDPIGRMMELVAGRPGYRFRAIPALDDNGESNFDFSPSRVGFSTAYYVEERRRQDPVAWAAKFQQAPYDREGALFAEDAMQWYESLPDDGRDWRVIYVADPAYGGGDWFAGIFMYVCGEGEDAEPYIEDVVFTKAPKEVTIPLNVAKIALHRPYVWHCEARDDATALYPERVAEALREAGVHTATRHIRGRAPSGSLNKMVRIVQFSGDILRKFHFRAPGHRDAAYDKFLENTWEYSTEGKNKNDDAPDVLAFGAQVLYAPEAARPRAKFSKRPF